ncbi:MAG TPA: DUF3047 domain-containing protein [Longimicrobiales bacterium]|nr:DUF3047 domain-containing protein [Longimicrobiales bacterium]
MTFERFRSRRRLRAFATVVLLRVLSGSPATALADDNCIVLDDFRTSAVGQFPADWKVRKDAAKKAYTVKEEQGTRFLHAQAEGLGVQAAKQVEWNLDEYPILAWRWRPVAFPNGADERESSRNDSVLAVYLLVPYSNIRGPRAVKYIWSEQARVGTSLESNMGLTKVRVIRSGRAGINAWSEERVDARATYLAAFAVETAPKPAGFGVLTDADDTKSTATGDYADFRACRR